ncbi:hypothetical protein GTS_50430 [Gandjariella thermophila]|uniref:SHOCT domain-containing protein n=2 Tax=Gandjariella thermophila TaxID=1931992 RepID=A0A4D4JEE6_9PSEU|nr:hypothetical protein GTS_50430 [Gandjariella thermophila]
MMFWYGSGMGMWGGLLMTLGSVLVLALLVVGVLAALRYRGRVVPQAGGASRPGEDILAERFARGEIDEDEYRRRLDTLRGTMFAAR